MDRRKFLAVTGSTTTIAALAGCSGNGGDSEPEDEPESEPESGTDSESGGGLGLTLTASDSYDEHVTYGNGHIAPANPDDGRPIGMTVSWEITVESAPEDAPCIGTEVAFAARDESGNVYWDVSNIHGETYTVGESHVEEYYIPVPTEDLDDPDALDAPAEMEVTADLDDSPDCE